MKRILSLILAMLLLAIPAMAEDSHAAHVYAPEGAGIALTMNDEWYHALANNLLGLGDRASSDPCEYADLFFIYVEDTANVTLENSVLLFSLSNRLEGSEHAPAVDGLNALTQSTLLKSENGRELLIWYNDKSEYPAAMADTLALPVERIIANPDDVTLSEPTPMPVAVGFDGIYGLNAIDLTPVEAADILAGKKLTMVNVWATYCNPCIAEMPELAQLHADYADKGFQIVGVLTDVGVSDSYDAETLEYGHAIIDQTGANYLHLIPGEGMMYGCLSNITAVPTTYFIDENGNQVGTEYVGGNNYEGWKTIVDELLAGME